MGRSELGVARGATIDLNRIATWVQVVRAGSITAAARALGRPKSSVSRAVKQLETELGLTLLARTTRKVALTRAGEHYLVSATEALRLLEEARAELVNEDGVPRGTVRLTAPLDPTQRFGSVLADALTEFSARYPHVRLDLLFTGRHIDLIAEGVDLALRAGTVVGNNLVARRLSTGSLVLVAAPSYLAKHGTPRKLSELAGHRAILFHGSGGSAQWRMSSGARSETVTVHGSINVDEMTFVLPLAERGAGIALLPSIMVLESLKLGRLVRILPQHTRREGAMYLVYPAQRRLPTRVELLRDFLYQRLRADLAGWED